MAAEGLSAAERQALVDRRLDEIDRALLGLLPRAERLALVADVEARVQALGDNVSLAREAPAESANTSPTTVATRARAHRSRLAFTAGVLGIIAVSFLILSPLLLIGLSMFGELLGETSAIILFALLTAVVACGGSLAVFGGGVSLFRLARRGQSATGTGWAITGLCTGALPMLLGFVGVISLLMSVMPAEHVQVTWSATTPVGAVPYAVPCAAPGAPGCPMPMPAPMMASPYGYACPVPPPGQPLVMPPQPATYAAPQLAAQPKPGPAQTPKLESPPEPKAVPNAEAKPEPMPEQKPELKELPSLPLNEPVEVDD